VDALSELVDLQARDLDADRARRHLADLPAAARVAELSSGLAHIQEQVENAQAALDDVERRRGVAEAQMTKAEDHHARACEQRDAATDPRLVEGFEREVAAAAVQEEAALVSYSEVDDEMARAEARLAELLEQQSVAEATLADAKVAASESAGDEQDQLTVAEAAIADLRTRVPPTLLEKYDRMRETRGGVVVAHYQAGTCGACNMTLSAVDVDRMKHTSFDVPLQCPECGSMLIRHRPAPVADPVTD
jgi:predicted  nucleic acid-binding Zn-ribbon protein